MACRVSVGGLSILECRVSGCSPFVYIHKWIAGASWYMYSIYQYFIPMSANTPLSILTALKKLRELVAKYPIVVFGTDATSKTMRSMVQYLSSLCGRVKTVNLSRTNTFQQDLCHALRVMTHSDDMPCAFVQGACLGGPRAMAMAMDMALRLVPLINDHAHHKQRRATKHTLRRHQSTPAVYASKGSGLRIEAPPPGFGPQDLPSPMHTPIRASDPHAPKAEALPVRCPPPSPMHRRVPGEPPSHMETPRLPRLNLPSRGGAPRRRSRSAHVV